MTSIMEKYGQCKYLDMETQSASDVLKRCIGDPSSDSVAPCKKYNYKMNQDINALVFDRPQKDNIFTSDDMLKNGGSLIKSDGNNTIEGFHNFYDSRTNDVYNGPGESFVPFGECPSGFQKCPYTGECVQICMNCKLNVNNKSKEFNEADPCFPEGVYAGIDNLGNTVCTCGSQGQYCSDPFLTKKMTDIFTTDGTMILSDTIGAVIVGDYSDVMSFAGLDY